MFNQLRNSIRKYFGISMREANGIFVLLIILIIVLLSPLIYNQFLYSEYSNFRLDSLKLDSLIHIYEEGLKKIPDPAPGIAAFPDTIYPFDPNTISYDEMILFGFDTVISRRITKYRNKNGRFIVKRDLLKIYDFPESFYNDLEDYILLPEEITETRPDHMGKPVMKKNIPESKSIQPRKIDINLADTSQLMILRGIGHILSNRIIKYRDLLGGYSNINQLDDVYGLRGKSLKLLKSVIYIDSLFMPEKIRINFSDWEEMVRHPYINSQLANNLLKLRSDKGYLKNIDQLRDIPYLNDSILRRIEPYIEF
jgi:DNA uptake protein ComE-like DNA-binding protein